MPWHYKLARNPACTPHARQCIKIEALAPKEAMKWDKLPSFAAESQVVHMPATSRSCLPPPAVLVLHLFVVWLVGWLVVFILLPRAMIGLAEESYPFLG